MTFRVGWKKAVGLLIFSFLAFSFLIRNEYSHLAEIVRNGAVVSASGVVEESVLRCELSNRYKVRLNSVKRFYDEKNMVMDECVYAYFSSPEQFDYGTNVKLKGRLFEYDPPDLEGVFDYRRFLELNRIRFGMRVKEYRLASAEGFGRVKRSFHRFRNVCVERILIGVEERDDQAVLIAVTAGSKSLMRRELMRSFRDGGVVHVLAISGLHVGMAALIFGTVLRLLPVSFRLRKALLPLPVFLYVIFCGGAESAVRAGVMISVWAVAGAMQRPNVPLNTLSVSGCILLMWNPLNLFKVGFLFSFSIVFVLILAWKRMEPLFASLSPERRLIPWSRIGSRWISWRIRSWFVRAFVMSFFAWTGASGLVLLTNGVLTPGCILANFFLSPLMFVVLCSAFLKAVFASGIFNILLVPALRGVITSATVFSHAPYSHSVGIVSFFAVFVMYLCLFAGLSHNRFRKVHAACFAAVVFFWAAAFSNRFVDERVFVFVSNNKAVVCITRSANDAVLVNCPESWEAMEIADFLGKNGVKRISKLVTFKNDRWLKKRITAFAERMEIGAVCGDEKLVAMFEASDNAFKVDQVLLPYESGFFRIERDRRLLRLTDLRSGRTLSVEQHKEGFIRIIHGDDIREILTSNHSEVCEFRISD